jgi:hypothetical protein
MTDYMREKTKSLRDRALDTMLRELDGGIADAGLLGLPREEVLVAEMRAAITRYVDQLSPDEQSQVLDTI